MPPVVVEAISWPSSGGEFHTQRRRADYLGLNDDYFVVEFQTTDDLIGKTIGEIIHDVKVNALVVKRNQDVHPSPDASWKVREGDRLVLGGWLEELRRLVKNL